MKKIIIGGSTGSIGKKTLEIIEKYPNDFQILCLIANKNKNIFINQIKKYNPKYVVFGEYIEELKDTNIEQIKEENIKEVFEQGDIFLNGISGIAGLYYTIEAIKTKIMINLANKESIIIGYEKLYSIDKDFLKRIIPVDSEHSSIFQLLQGVKKSDVKKVIITASGGVIKNKHIENLTPEKVLSHPNWSMGNIITVDSSTMVNKAYEVVEAHYLFQIDYKNIAVLFHPQSVVHGIIQLKDDNFLSHFSKTDMYYPIKYALFFPNRIENKNEKLFFNFMSRLEFEPVNYELYPNFHLMLENLKKSPMFRVGVIYGNQEAAKLFLNKKITFNQIYELNEYIQKNIDFNEDFNFEEIVRLKEYIDRLIKRFIGGNKW